MARHRTWDSEAYTPYYEDDDPSLYRPSIWRRLLMISIVLIPIVAAALLIYAFIRVYIIPPTVAVAPTSIGPTSIAAREAFVPMSVVSRTDPAPATPELEASPAQPTAPTRSVARPLPEPRREPPPQAAAGSAPNLLRWPGASLPAAREAAPTLPPEITTGSTSAPAQEVIPLPRRRPRPTAAVETVATRAPRPAVAADPAPPPPAPSDPVSSPSYGTPN